jgi:hypothetical protein
MIEVKVNTLHWNYFLTLGQELEATSRYIEFCDANLRFQFETPSFTHGGRRYRSYSFTEQGEGRRR